MIKDVRHYDAIVAPVITEKATIASENNQFVFKVARNATKSQIKAAIEQLFDVKVTAVNTLLRKGKTKAFRGVRGRQQDVKKAIGRFKAVYFGATGGTGALLGRCVASYEVVAYPDLGPEAVARLRVLDMPLFVVNDCFGNDLYEMGMRRYGVG